MALKEYICSQCQRIQYVFEGEEDNRLQEGLCRDLKKETHDFRKMPPSCSVVHSTDIFMLSQLDSIHTIDELDRRLTSEAADEREVRSQNEARKNI